MTRAPWEWNGMEHWTHADLMETISLISEQDEADSFVESYSELWDDEDNAIQSLRYFIQVIATVNPEIAAEVCDLMGLDFPEKHEAISPLHTFGTTSYGVAA